MTDPYGSGWPARITGAALAVVLSLGLVVGGYRTGAAQVEPAPEATGSSETVLPDGFEAIGELYLRIHDEAVDPPSDDVLVEGALEGMVETLDDPYAVYYDPAAFSEFSEGLEGEFSGVGLVLEETPEGLVVVSVLPDSPAEEAGLEAGERIVSVDGDDVSEMPLSQVVDLVRGEEGTSVTLGVTDGPAGPREVEVVRERIDLPVLEAELMDDGTAYVRFASFTRGAAGKLRDALVELEEQGADGVVLDLRGNPGGLLGEAVDVASVFLDTGTVVEVQERVGERRVWEATGDEVSDLPLVVLVSETTASSAEIVAGAIQDLDRGTVVGLPTFGKGTVQTIRSLSNGGGFKLTTAEYFTPSGDSIEGVGVAPDMEVSDPEEQVAVALELLHEETTAGVGAGRG